MTTNIASMHRMGVPNGSGPLVVLVHGLEDVWETWVPLVEFLRQSCSWRFVALDLPWRAGNDYRWRRSGSACWFLAKALERVEDPVDVLVGHSFGATVLLDLLATSEHPPARGAILAAPFFCPPELRISWEVFDQSRKSFDHHIREGLRVRLGPRSTSIADELFETMIEKLTDRIGPAAFLAVFEQFTASATLPLQSVTVPTLVLAGRSDPGLASGPAAALAREMPSSTVLLKDDYDHFCHVRRTEDMAEHMIQFVHSTCLGPYRHRDRPVRPAPISFA